MGSHLPPDKRQTSLSQGEDRVIYKLDSFSHSTGVWQTDRWWTDGRKCHGYRS